METEVFMMLLIIFFLNLGGRGGLYELHHGELAKGQPTQVLRSGLSLAARLPASQITLPRHP